MVQVLGRLALSFGIFLVAGIAGWIAGAYSYATVFLVGLIIPLVSVSGAALITLKPVESSPIDWRILGGGMRTGAFVLTLAFRGYPLRHEEIMFVVSMAVVCAMLVRVVHDLDETTKRTIFYAAIIIFIYRAAPLTGQGYTWFAIDVLGFDEAFQGTLGQIGAGLALIGMWLFSDAITRRPVPTVLLWLTIVTTILSLPALGLVLGLADWTERVRLWREDDRHGAGGDLAVRAAQHDPAVDAHRDLRAQGASRDVVCASWHPPSRISRWSLGNCKPST